jgi:hypothetical protein
MFIAEIPGFGAGCFLRRNHMQMLTREHVGMFHSLRGNIASTGWNRRRGEKLLQADLERMACPGMWGEA